MAYGITVLNNSSRVQIDGTLINSRIVASGYLTTYTSISFGQRFTITYSNFGFIPSIYISPTMNALNNGYSNTYWKIVSLTATQCVIDCLGVFVLGQIEQLYYCVTVPDTSTAGLTGYGAAVYNQSGQLCYATNRGVQIVFTATATIAVPRGAGASAPTQITTINIPTSYTGQQYFFVNPVKTGNWINQDASWYTIELYRTGTYQYQIKLASQSFASGFTNVNQSLVFPTAVIY